MPVNKAHYPYILHYHGIQACQIIFLYKIIKKALSLLLLNQRINSQIEPLVSKMSLFNSL